MIDIEIVKEIKVDNYIIDKYDFESGKFYFIKVPYVFNDFFIKYKAEIMFYRKVYIEQWQLYQLIEEYKEINQIEYLDNSKYKLDEIIENARKYGIKKLNYYELKCLSTVIFGLEKDIIVSNLDAMTDQSIIKYFEYLKYLSSIEVNKTFISVFSGGDNIESNHYFSKVEIFEVENNSDIIDYIPNININ